MSVPELPAEAAPPRLPALDMKDCTFGSCRTMLATACCRSTMALKEMPSAASVRAKIRPVSSLGMNPLGITLKRMIVATRIAAEKIMVARRRGNTQRRPTA